MTTIKIGGHLIVASNILSVTRHFWPDHTMLRVNFSNSPQFIEVAYDTPALADAAVNEIAAKLEAIP